MRQGFRREMAEMAVGLFVEPWGGVFIEF